MKSSKIIEVAKEKMPMTFTSRKGNKVSPYICDQIEQVGIDRCQYMKAREIKNKISELIEDEFSLVDWVVAKGYATEAEIYDNPKKMQQTRLNFMDDLIKYYKQLGD
jgi:hypothetical protein